MKLNLCKPKELINSEESDLSFGLKNLDRLRSKWFKLFSTKKAVDFLEFYCKKKVEFIKELEKFDSEYGK